MDDILSTTKLLKIAHEISGGKIADAIEHLHHMMRENANASSAINVLRMRMKKYPGVTTFWLNRGFVEVA